MGNKRHLWWQRQHVKKAVMKVEEWADFGPGLVALVIGHSMIKSAKARWVNRIKNDKLANEKRSFLADELQFLKVAKEDDIYHKIHVDYTPRIISTEFVRAFVQCPQDKC